VKPFFSENREAEEVPRNQSEADTSFGFRREAVACRPKSVKNERKDRIMENTSCRKYSLGNCQESRSGA
jgi:hypothetical protein